MPDKALEAGLKLVNEALKPILDSYKAGYVQGAIDKIKQPKHTIRHLIESLESDVGMLLRDVKKLERERDEHNLHVHHLSPCCGVGYDEDTLKCEKCGEVVR